MTQFVYLTGSEAVEAAGRQMAQAAQSMNHAAGELASALERHQRFMDDWLNRFEEIMRPAPANLTSFFCPVVGCQKIGAHIHEIQGPVQNKEG